MFRMNGLSLVGVTLLACGMSGTLAAAGLGDQYLIYSSQSKVTYITPSAFANPADSAYPRLYFELPGSLYGAEILDAHISFTGLTYGNDGPAALDQIVVGGSNIALASEFLLPFNFGQYTSVDVEPALQRWLSSDASRSPNEGLLLLRAAFADIVTELHPVSAYWPTLTIHAVETLVSKTAGAIVDAGLASAFAVQWDLDDIATLYGLYAAGSGHASIDDETWYYTANEYNTSGTWGDSHALGEAWVDDQGYKHIYLGSGLTTAPAPVPLPGAIGLFALACALGASRNVARGRGHPPRDHA